MLRIFENPMPPGCICVEARVLEIHGYCQIVDPIPERDAKRIEGCQDKTIQRL
jgi:hypothetical protein